jgi:hypothetical protein
MPNQPRAIKADRQNRHAAPQKKSLPAFHSDSHTPPSLLETQHQSGSSRPAQNIIGNHLLVIRTTENRSLLGFPFTRRHSACCSSGALCPGTPSRRELRETVLELVYYRAPVPPFRALASVILSGECRSTIRPAVACRCWRPDDFLNLPNDAGAADSGHRNRGFPVQEMAGINDVGGDEIKRHI